MIRLLLAAAIALGSCAPVAAPSAPVFSDYPCFPGEVILWNDTPSPCDIVAGSNTLTILGLSAPDCADAGGRFEYEACVEVDF